MADKAHSQARTIRKEYDNYDKISWQTLLKKKMEANNLKAASK